MKKGFLVKPKAKTEEDVLGRMVRTVSGRRQFRTDEGFARVSYEDQIRALEREMFAEAMEQPLPRAYSFDGIDEEEFQDCKYHYPKHFNRLHVFSS